MNIFSAMHTGPHLSLSLSSYVPFQPKWGILRGKVYTCFYNIETIRKTRFICHIQWKPLINCQVIELFSHWKVPAVFVHSGLGFPLPFDILLELKIRYQQSTYIFIDIPKMRVNSLCGVIHVSPSDLFSHGFCGTLIFECKYKNASATYPFRWTSINYADLWWLHTIIYLFIGIFNIQTLFYHSRWQCNSIYWL